MNFLEKYAADGELQFLLPDVLELPPISEHGSIGEIVRVFGRPDELRTAVNQLQTLLYAESSRCLQSRRSASAFTLPPHAP